MLETTAPVNEAYLRLLGPDALNTLSVEDPIAARVVELRYFAGLGNKQVAASLGVPKYVGVARPVTGFRIANVTASSTTMSKR